MDAALIVVVSYFNKALTERAINSLRSSTYPVNIAVWDNASDAETVSYLRQQDDIQLHLSDTNVMWTPAVNGAIEKFWSGERFIGYMNNDAAPLPHTVERLVNILEDPMVGLVGPSMEHIGGPQDIANCAGHSIVAGGGFIEDGLKTLPPKRVNFVLGAFAMLRKEVWDEIGPLDPDMPLGADDHDYAIRIKDAGYQIMVAQNAFCKHAGHASISAEPKSRRQWDDWGQKSWDAFNRKWAGYYANEEEAIKAHWGGDFVEGWVRGTGWEAFS